MRRYTLDTNCIIALAESRPEALKIRHLLKARDAGVASIQVAAIAAAERQLSGRQLENFAVFRIRLNQLGLEPVELLLPPMYVGISYADWCLVHGEKLSALEERIHAILFPSAPFRIDNVENPVGSKPWLRWLNAKCDVLTMWCHLYHGGDVFVTSDNNFHVPKKKAQLLVLGAGAIIRPDELP